MRNEKCRMINDTAVYRRACERDLKGPRGRAERRGAPPGRPLGGLKMISVLVWTW